MSSEQNNKPLARVQLFPVSAAIFRNVGPKGTNYSVVFERCYRDQSGKYQTSSSFSGTELLLLAKVADLSHTRINEMREADRTESQSDDEAA